MAEIHPFRGLRYDPREVGDLDRLISPPYDVISDALQKALYERSAHNIVRIDLCKAEAGDGQDNNRYTRSRDTLKKWVREGALRRESVDCIYYMEEDYRDEAGKICTRKGFLASVRLEDPDSGIYRPHEKTLAGPKQDRIELTKACGCQLSPIFSLYDDAELAILPPLEAAAREGAVLAEVKNDEGVVTRLWAVHAGDAVRGVAEGMAGKSFFIADGHHRYETALAYRDWMRERTGHSGEGAPWNRVMMYLSNMRDPGLTIFPTHRGVFSLEGLSVSDFLSRCEEYFEVEVVPDGVDGLAREVQAVGPGQRRFGLCAAGTTGGWTLTLRDEGAMAQLLGDRVPSLLHTLDVTILHSLILERLLGIDEEAQAQQRNLRYIKGGAELLRRVVVDEELQLGFMLNPTSIDEVQSVAGAGLRMPQKSTFFYPKLVTGLVLHPLQSEGMG